MSNCKPVITSCESAAAKAVSLGGYLNRQDVAEHISDRKGSM